MNIACRLTNVSKTYVINKKDGRDLFVALDKLNLKIFIGDVLGIIGLNGCGKSTLLKLLARTTAPSTGRILLHGDLLPMLEVGSGFQPDLSGRENIKINYALVSSGKKLTDTIIRDIALFAETEEFLEEPLKHYSSGMQMRLAFSIAVHTSPDIIIIDEVLAVGDGKFQKKCFSKIRELTRTSAVIMVSHNMAHIQEICNKVLYLSKGKVRFIGEPKQATSMYMKDLDD